MKSRMGFVSNSSSSSFVLVGVFMNMSTFEPESVKFDEKVCFYEKNGLDVVADIESETVYIGSIIASDEMCPDVDMSVFEVAERGKEVLRKLNALDPVWNEKSIKLLSWTMER